jgi:hypothetical protein
MTIDFRKTAAELFSKFNARFSDGALPRYRIEILPVEWEKSWGLLGVGDSLRLTIRSSQGLSEDEKRLREVLIHEMAHAALYDVEVSEEDCHGWQFLSELLRLLRVGAPVNPPESDQYWGEGFAEADLIKRARAEAERSEFKENWTSVTSLVFRRARSAAGPLEDLTTSPDALILSHRWNWCGTT